ncbi:MAG: ATP-binding cassette domain-containing protein [Planctomycetota bacterium]|nr:MAG: ATP-binding cassette domain-containing protein [Planctomycetota bacterium]
MFLEMEIEKKIYSFSEPLSISLSLKMEQGEFAALFGPSGAGKTTIIRMIAGLDRPDQGYIKVDGEYWYSYERGICLPPQKRSIGLLFQDFGLFPHMTVEENLFFAFEKVGKQEKQAAESMGKTLGIHHLMNQYPYTLSGGEQQRVALGRTLLRNPKILLLDEPLSALDKKRAFELEQVILRIHQEKKTTTLLVSHEMAEVFGMAEKVYLLEKGHIIKEGTPQEIFLQKKISGKLQFTCQVLEIIDEEGGIILTASLQGKIIQLALSEREGKGLKRGDLIGIAVKAFQPFFLGKIEKNLL